MILEVRHLELVDAIHREGQITAAAERLSISQPASSHALRKLERRLGTRLFERHANGMRITAEGRRLLEAADRVLGELDRAEHDVRLVASGVRGVVRVSTQCYSAYHWVPHVIGRFRTEFPGIRTKLEPDAMDRLPEALDRGEVDVALMHDPPEGGRYAVEPVLEDELVAVVPPDHPWADRPHVDAGDFRDATLVLHSLPEARTLHATVLGPGGVRPAAVLHLHLTEAVVGAARTALGVGVLARWAVTRELESGALVAVAVTKGGLHRRWHSVMPSRRREEPALARLVELLRGHTLD